MKQKVFVIALGVSVLLAASLLFPRERKPVPTEHFHRIVSLAPSMTDTIIALDAAHKLVGVTVHCQTKQLPAPAQIGSFAEPNFETIMALRPDLVLIVPHVMNRNVLDQLRMHSINVYSQQPDSLADIKEINLTLAHLLGDRARGQSLNDRIDQAIIRAQERLRSRFLPKETTALLAVSSRPLVVAGASTFAGEIIQALGLKNSAATSTPWPVWPLENLLHDPPHFLISIEGVETTDAFTQLLASIGSKERPRLIFPKRPIFRSPSAALIDDLEVLVLALEAIP